MSLVTWPESRSLACGPVSASLPRSERSDEGDVLGQQAVGGNGLGDGGGHVSRESSRRLTLIRYAII